MILSDIYHLVKIFCLSAIILFNMGSSYFVYYTQQDKKCKCGYEWCRNIIKYGGVFVAVVALVAYFTPFISLINHLPLISSIFSSAFLVVVALVIYCCRQYIQSLQQPDCPCHHQQWVNNMEDITKYMTIFYMGMMTIMIVFCVNYWF